MWHWIWKKQLNSQNSLKQTECVCSSTCSSQFCSGISWDLLATSVLWVLTQWYRYEDLKCMNQLRADSVSFLTLKWAKFIKFRFWAFLFLGPAFHAVFAQIFIWVKTCKRKMCVLHLFFSDFTFQGYKLLWDI